MTRKDYIRIADILREIGIESTDYLVEDLIAFFKQDIAKIDTAKFRKAVKKLFTLGSDWGLTNTANHVIMNTSKLRGGQKCSIAKS